VFDLHFIYLQLFSSLFLVAVAVAVSSSAGSSGENPKTIAAQGFSADK
jgi:hypothetical protein